MHLPSRGTAEECQDRNKGSGWGWLEIYAKYIVSVSVDASADDLLLWRGGRLVPVVFQHLVEKENTAVYGRAAHRRSLRGCLTNATRWPRRTLGMKQQRERPQRRTPALLVRRPSRVPTYRAHQSPNECMLRSLAHANFSLRVCCSLFPQPVVRFCSALLSLRGMAW